MLRASSPHKVIGQMWIISRRLISRSLSRANGTSISHLFGTIFSITAASTSEVALIHQLVSGGTDGSTVDRLVKLWSELLLRGSPGSHLHPIHIDYDFAVVLAVILATDTVIAGGSHHELILLLVSLRSLRVIFSLFLRLTIRNHAHSVILRETT